MILCTVDAETPHRNSHCGVTMLHPDQLVRLLVANGADYCAQDPKGNTPLHLVTAVLPTVGTFAGACRLSN